MISSIPMQYLFFLAPQKKIWILSSRSLMAATFRKRLSVHYKIRSWRHILIATPLMPPKIATGSMWFFAIATIFTTMVVGSYLFWRPTLSYPGWCCKGLPFTVAIMTVLGAHEAGHYIVAEKAWYAYVFALFYPIPEPDRHNGCSDQAPGTHTQQESLIWCGYFRTSYRTYRMVICKQ